MIAARPLALELLRTKADVGILLGTVLRQFGMMPELDQVAFLLRRHWPVTFDEKSQTVNLTTSGAFMFKGGVVVKWVFARMKRGFRKAEQPTSGTEFFDADRVGKEIVLRHWRAGDRFQPIGLKRAVKLQDLFTNAKIPRERRHQLVVAEARNGIFWVEGLRISENFKLTAETTLVLNWGWRRPSD